MTEEEYREKVREELLAVRTDVRDVGFRDQFGFVVDIENGDPTTRGEGTLHTAIATVALATGNFHQDAWERAQANQFVLQLLETLRDRGWGNQDGHGLVHPIRHVDVSDFDASGNPFRLSPLTKDSFGAIMAACIYAYRCPHSSDAVRSVAVELFQKWRDYLVAHQWMTHSNYIAGEFERDDDEYRHICNEHCESQDFKGPESFMLLPHEHYALQCAEVALEQKTSHWDIWSQGIAVELGMAFTNLGAPYIGKASEQGMRLLLDHLEYRLACSVPLGPLGWSCRSIEGAYSIRIPEGVRESVSRTFGDLIRDLIRDYVRGQILSGPQASQLLGIAISRVLDGLPAGIGPSTWRSILTLGLRQITPWLDGSTWVEAATLATTLQILRRMNVSVQSYTLWSYATIFETRPELADLLRPLVQEFFRGQRADGNPNGLWAWLAENNRVVEEQLTTFYTHPPDRWSSFAFGSTPFDEWFNSPRKPEKQSPRLDYLVLHGLKEKGPPRGVTDVGQEWLESFRHAAAQAFGLRNLIDMFDIAQLAEIMLTLKRGDLREVFDLLDTSRLAEILERLDDTRIANIIPKLDNLGDVKHVVERLDDTRFAAVVSRLSEGDVRNVIEVAPTSKVEALPSEIRDRLSGMSQLRNRLPW